jgi:hypothetical protein
MDALLYAALYTSTVCVKMCTLPSAGSKRQPKPTPAEAVAAGALIHQIAAARASARAVGDADSPTGGPFSVMDVCREIPAVVGDALSAWA